MVNMPDVVTVEYRKTAAYQHWSTRYHKQVVWQSSVIEFNNCFEHSPIKDVRAALLG